VKFIRLFRSYDPQF